MDGLVPLVVSGFTLDAGDSATMNGSFTSGDSVLFVSAISIFGALVGEELLVALADQVADGSAGYSAGLCDLIQCHALLSEVVGHPAELRGVLLFDDSLCLEQHGIQ